MFVWDRDVVDGILGYLHRQRSQEECTVLFVLQLYHEACVANASSIVSRGLQTRYQWRRERKPTEKTGESRETPRRRLTGDFR